MLSGVKHCNYLNLASAFKEGVHFVELAALTQVDFVAAHPAKTLEIKEEPGKPLLGSLIAYLKPCQILLILDNCEHLLDACAKLTVKLLQACPNLVILATSREALGIAGETGFVKSRATRAFQNKFAF